MFCWGHQASAMHNPYHHLHPLVKLVVLAFMGVGWILFVMLVVWSLARIRCISGWEEFFARDHSSPYCEHWAGLGDLSSITESMFKP